MGWSNDQFTGTLVIPTGATTGARIEIDGATGRIEVYDAANVLVYVIDGAIPGATAGPAGAPQVEVLSNGVNGLVQFPTNDADEATPGRLASVVYNQGAATERMALEVQGPSHTVDSDRLVIQLNSSRADSSTPPSVSIFDVATQDSILVLDTTRIQANEILQIVPDAASALSALFVNAFTGHTGRLIRAQLNAVDQFTVEANGDTNAAGTLTAGNMDWGTAQTAAPGAGGGVTSVNVNFSKTFPQIPRVLITPSSAADPGTVTIRGYVNSETTTGFTITAYRSTNAATNFRWWAVGDA
jgi:hypothetical protein